MSTGKPAAPKLLLVQTGGTIDKEYPATQGGYAFDIGEAAALAIVSRCAPTIPTECMTACRKDSSELNAEDRAQIVAKIKAHPAKRVLVTHGTDTMIETAHAIGEQRMPKTIVLTGSFRPAAFSVSDAEFNTGGAVAALGMLGNGVYIAMNGLVLSYDKVSRDAATGYFIRTPGGAAAAAGGKAAAQAATAEGRSAAAKPFVPGPAAKRGQQKGGGGGGGNRKIAASGAAGGGGGGGHEMPEGSLKGLQGAMVWYDETKNYGFISPDNKGKDIYVHKTAVLESHIRIEQLVQGQRLRFDVSERQVMDKKAGKPSNRPVAVNLSLLPPA